MDALPQGASGVSIGGSSRGWSNWQLATGNWPLATGNWWQERTAWLARLTDARIAAAQRPARTPYAITVEMADRAGMTMVVVVVVVVVLSLRAMRGQRGRPADRK